jgi:hypothetical protein
MKTLASILILLISIQGMSQQHDSSFANHISVIKNPQKVIMPEIVDPCFCQKLSTVSIADSIKFKDDDGQELYYYLSIEISFSAKGKVVSTIPRSKGKATYEVVRQIAELLRNSDWKTTNKKQSIIFECMLKDGLFKDAALMTLNNYQKQIICK